MTTAAEEKAKLLGNLIKAPSDVIMARKTLIDNLRLATSTRDSQATALSVDDVPYIASQLARQRAILQGASDGQELKYTFRRSGTAPGQFGQNITFSLPSTSQFGYYVLDDNGNDIPLDQLGGSADISNFFLVKNKTSGQMVSIDDDLTAFSEPARLDYISETLGSIKTKTNLVEYKLLNKPVKKGAAIPSLKIFCGTVLVGYIFDDEKIKNIDNNQGISINTEKSYLDFDKKTISLTFTTIPTGNDTLIKIQYDYVASENKSSDTVTAFNNETYIWERQLTFTPVLETVEIFVNNVKYAGMSNKGEILSLKHDSKVSFFDKITKQLKIRFNDIKTSDKNVIRVDYIKEDIANVIETIHTYNDTDITLTDIVGTATFTYSNIDVIANTFRILLDQDWTAKQTYSLNDRVVGISTDGEIRVYKCSTAGMSGTVPPVWPISGTVADGTVVWTYLRASIKSNSLGVISGSYDTLFGEGTGVVSGSINATTNISTQLTSLTLTKSGGGSAVPDKESLVRIVYSQLNGLTNWLTKYEYLNITSLTTSIYGGTNTLLKVNGLSSVISKAPDLLKSYPLKKYSDHSIYGKLIVVCEGLEMNPNWLPIYIRNDGVATISTTGFSSTAFGASGFANNAYLGKTLRIYNYNSKPYEDYVIASHTGSNITTTTNLSASGTSLKFEVICDTKESTLLTNTDMKNYFGWLNPDNESLDDVLKAANTTNISMGKKVDTSYPFIEKNPFFPATDGKHETQQNPAYGKDDIFYGHWIHTEGDPLEYKWSVHSDEKWKYNVNPLVSNPTPTDAENSTAFAYTDSMTPKVSNVTTYSTASASTVPSDSIDGVGDGTRYELNTANGLISVVTYSSAGTVRTVGSVFSNYGSDLSVNIIADVTFIDAQMDKLTTLQALVAGSPAGYKDPNNVSTDTTFWTAFDDYETATKTMKTLKTYHTTWAANWGITTSGTFKRRSGDSLNSVTYTTSEHTTAKTNLDTFKTAINNQIASINTRIGNPTIPNSYSNRIFSAVNSMVDRSIKYVTNVIRDYYSLFDVYSTLEGDRVKYRFYEKQVND